MFVLLLLVTFAISSSNARVNQRDRVEIPLVQHHADLCASHWHNDGVADEDATITLSVALRHRNLDKLERQTNEISDPFHDNYQNFLSHDDVVSLIAPIQADRDAVINWIQSNSPESTSILDNGDSLQLTISALTASKLFESKLYSYHHLSNSIAAAFGCHIRTLTIPAFLSSIMHSVFSSHPFDQSKPSSQQPIQQSHPSTSLDSQFMSIPQSVWSIYGMPITNDTSSSKVRVAHIQLSPLGFEPKNVAAYAQNTTVNMPTAFHGQSIPSLGQSPSFDMFMQLASGINPSSEVWLYEASQPSTLYDFLVYFNNLTDALPHVLHLPSDAAPETYWGSVYVQRLDAELHKLAARGVTVISSTGPNGAHAGDLQCRDNTTHVVLPASSQWVLSIGSTLFTNPIAFDPSIAPACTLVSYSCFETGDEEVGQVDDTQYISGGGFSEFFAQPMYQSDAVNKFLESSGLPTHLIVHKENRAIPDISMFGMNAFVVSSDPTVAPACLNCDIAAQVATGVIAALTERYIQLTGQSFGFINPLLYRLASHYPAVFNDITVGSNRCVPGYCEGICEGYSAVPGWDAMSGLGSINFEAFMNAVQQMVDAGQIKKPKPSSQNHRQASS